MTMTNERDRAAIEKGARKSVALDRGPVPPALLQDAQPRVPPDRRAHRGTLDSASGVRPILLIQTTGRTTGRTRTTPLVYLADGDSWVVVASNAGRDTDPSWVHNLRADPTATIVVGRDTIGVIASELDEAEAATLWPALDAMNAQYGEYRKLTTRTPPVIRLRRA